MLIVERSSVLHTAQYLVLASNTFGQDGAAALRRLLDAVARIFLKMPPDALLHGITVIVPVGAQAAAPAPPSARHDDSATLAVALGTSPSRPTVTITDDDAFVIDLDTRDPVADSSAAIVYEHDGATERLHAAGQTRAIPRLVPGTASAFANPTYSELEDALRAYARRALDSGCDVLSTAWAGGGSGPRLVFRAKPESTMRDSLWAALRWLLRHADVDREYPTDATKPVDIHVRWHTAPVEAMIEVKWIGRSLTTGKSDHLDYGEARANDGAGQLADYLERQRANNNATALKGYLVVFDGRRKGVKGPDDRLTRENATHFENRDITYNPDHTLTMGGFQPPVRLFMRARETHLLEAA